MKEIDLPTMTPEERRLLLALEYPKRRSVVAWWFPLLVLFLVYGVLGFCARKAHADGNLVDPSSLVCTSRTDLEDAHWKRVPAGRITQIESDSKYRVIPAQTLKCVDPLGREFVLREKWYEKADPKWRKLQRSKVPTLPQSTN